MDKELQRNGSGYYDPTAYKALSTIYKERKNKMEIYRGDLFEYEMRDKDEAKVALVVSADFRANDRYINVIILTDEPKGTISVPITTGSGIKYADCGMVSFATSDRLLGYLKSVNEEEMCKVDEGIIKCLGLENVKPLEIVVDRRNEGFVPEHEFDEQMAQAKAEAKIYKDLYEQLLAKMLG